MTRFQKERWTEVAGEYPKVDAEFLRDSRFRNAIVLHPLPRVGELDVSFDQDSRAAYFRQASYGVPVRMALIALLLNANGEFTFADFDTGCRDADATLCVRASDLVCPNGNCITHDPLEAANAVPKFHRIESKPARLRCFYCETDME